MAPQIRTMRPEDIDTVMELDRVTFEDLQAKLSGRPFHLPLREREFFEFWLSTDPEGALVAEEDGRIIGLNINHARGASGWFGPLAVSPDAQSAGTGKALLRAGMDYLQRAGCALIGLDTYPNNPVAVSMYLKHGFEIVGSTVQLRLALPEGQNAPEPDGALRVEDVTSDALGAVAAMEERASGFARGKDFRFLLDWDQAFGLQVPGREALLGYLWGYRKRGKGVIGCVHVADEDRFEEIATPLLGSAFERFVGLGIDQAVVLSDGRQSRLLRLLFRLGFQTQSTMVKLHQGTVQPGTRHAPLASEKG